MSGTTSPTPGEKDIDIARSENAPRSTEADLAKVDTVHNDEALKVLANYHGDQEWVDKEEKKLRRKIDWRLMPVLCATYGLQYYDKAMLSQAVSNGVLGSFLQHVLRYTGVVWPKNRS